MTPLNTAVRSETMAYAEAVEGFEPKIVEAEPTDAEAALANFQKRAALATEIENIDLAYTVPLPLLNAGIDLKSALTEIGRAEKLPDAKRLEAILEAHKQAYDFMQDARDSSRMVKLLKKSAYMLKLCEAPTEADKAEDGNEVAPTGGWCLKELYD